jgi:uncharacterized membrane protein YqjE
MFDPKISPEDWLSSRTLPHISRERLPFGRPLAQATFDWIGMARELIGGPPDTLPEPPVTRPQPPGQPAPPVPHVLAAPLVLGPYSIEQVGQRVELRIGNATRWAVDAALFGGTPQVTLTTEPGSAHVALANAFYPGTTIPADLKAHIFNDAGTWRIRVRLKFGAFDATLALQPWLDRTTPAVSLAGLDLSCCPFGPASELRAEGVAAAGFTADWVLGVFGPNIFALEGYSDHVTADLALIVPIPAGGPTFLLPQTLRRTAMLVFSDTQFPLVPEISQPWPRFRRGAFRFDGLALDLASRLAASLLGLARTHLELASVEFTEERDRIQRQLTLLLAAMGLLLFAVLFVAAWIVVYFWDTNRLTAIASVAFVFAATGAVLLLMRSRLSRTAPTPFAATMAELERDRAALAGNDADPEPAAPPSP